MVLKACEEAASVSWVLDYVPYDFLAGVVVLRACDFK
jgi:hypothetical protein